MSRLGVGQYLQPRGRNLEREKLKDFPKLRRGNVSGGLEVDRKLRALLRNGGHLDPRNTAGHDEIEIRQIRRHVESEAMPRHPVASMYADRRDLAAIRPYARKTGAAFSGYPVFTECPDQRFFNRSQVPVQILPVAL